MKLWKSSKKTEPQETDQRLDAATEPKSGKNAGPERTGVNALATRAMVLGVYGLIGLGAVGGVAGLAAATSAPETPALQEAYRPTTSAEGVALTYVTAWLQATRSDQELIKATTGSGLSVAPLTPVKFSNVSVAAAERTEQEDLVSVTVSALVDAVTPEPAKKSAGTGAEEEPSASQAAAPHEHDYQVRYWQVAVQESADGRLQVVGNPAPVPGPARSDQELTLNYSQRLDSSSEIGQSTVGFLQSYAAGQGETSRYVAPGSTVRGIVPAPYTRVDVMELRADRALDQVSPGQPVHVLVQAEAELASTEGDRQAITIALTLQEREDRWEVLSVDPAPLTTLRTAP
ncbi:conjugal transfer protein [Streptomyces rishiriensis]|uniref:conjugal transfer protein n=1 Tax=Streptomyces rishiriensis TaxID=68264 RepID=UPI0037B5FB5A